MSSNNDHSWSVSSLYRLGISPIKNIHRKENAISKISIQRSKVWFNIVLVLWFTLGTTLRSLLSLELVRRSFSSIRFTGCKISGYTPVNSAAVAGKPMIMPCGVHPNETMYRPTVEWKFQSINNTQTELLFNGYNIIKTELGLFIRDDTEGELYLEKNRTQLKDAGAYQCIKRIHKNQSFRTETNIAQLTILGMH